jgi:hypothetical protein
MVRTMNEEERLQILEMIEKGVITASEGVRLLNSLQGEPDEVPVALPRGPGAEQEKRAEARYSEAVLEEAMPEDTQASTPAARFEAGVNRWRNFWWIPLVVGIVITAVSALLMFVAYLGSGFGFWFACLWFPLLFGVLVMVLAAASRTARWLHVRIQQAPGERPQSIGISMPIPLRFTAWIMRLIKPRISGMDNLNLDEALHALEKVTPEEPFYVKVNEDDSGEKVEVYIG